MTSRRCAAIAACLSLASPNDSAAQHAYASVAGIVRAADGKAIALAVITDGRRLARTDSLGRYQLDSLPAGAMRIRVRAIGFSLRDTTIVFAAGVQKRWDVAMAANGDLYDDWATRAKDDAKAGRIDSIASRFIKPNRSLALPLGAFGSKLFAAIVAERGRDSNTVLSPLSAGMALSLVRFGARGTTAGALDSVLGTSQLDRATIENRGAEMMRALSQRTDVVLETANAVWVDTTAVLTPGFRASAERWYATASTLPLGSDSARVAINHWADSVTHGKINKVLPENLSDTTRLFIANAVYFNGKWFEPFEKSLTKPGDFTLASGQKVTVPRMNTKGYFAFARANGYQVLRLPYRTGKVAMYVILPDSGTSFDAIAKKLQNGLVPAEPLTQKSEVHVVLPRFRSELTLDLRSPLIAMGAGVAFDCDMADFSAMAQPRARVPMPLCIEKATQKVYVDVNEEGTEAAAVTGFTMVTVTSYTPPIYFVVDRPFLFVIRDETTGTELFVGRIARP